MVKSISTATVLPAFLARVKTLGFTHDEIAKRSNLARSRVTEILGGRIVPNMRPKTYRSMCAALELDPNTLQNINNPIGRKEPVMYEIVLEEDESYYHVGLVSTEFEAMQWVSSIHGWYMWYDQEVADLEKIDDETLYAEAESTLDVEKENFQCWLFSACLSEEGTECILEHHFKNSDEMPNFIIKARKVGLPMLPLSFGGDK